MYLGYKLSNRSIALDYLGRLKTVTWALQSVGGRQKCLESSLQRRLD